MHVLTSSLVPRMCLASLTLKGYDQTIVPMAVVMSLLCFGLVISGLGLLFFFVFPTHYARPLRYDIDVIGRDYS